MRSNLKPPLAIIDNLEHLENPFKLKRFSTGSFPLSSVSGAETDLEYALKFLFSYNGSSGTFNSYRREIERLLQWAWRIEGVSVLNLKREDIESFIQFGFDPPESWIGVKNVARFISKNGLRVANSDWRPFVVSVSKSQFRAGKKASIRQFTPSQAGVKATFTALSSFFEYLIQEGLTSANPVSLIKQKSKFIQKDQLGSAVRRISLLQWEYVLETAELMAQQDPQEHERTLFIMNCLFAMYLRISELVADERSTPVMGDFRKDHDGNWWFYVTGKGNKNRTITVCDEMLAALRRYRHHLGLSPMPLPGEQIPLVSKVKGRTAISSTRQIRRIVQLCFDEAYHRMCADKLIEDAEELKTATVHWLRHTGISEDVKFRPREHVRDDAGHASMATTDRYIDSDRRERHASARRKKIKDIG